ncbi:hypothetical protein K1T71_007265 [Dendrolimus kikuchii]|uniref:Uncharacterized protein n=1 Tax=Dendrolimus kikuchii TaxID=765133 RepID=A0ACC1CZX9_9NEOP|nr:hypothetical protein K1T71_007265 [Dendrolimus kikuchii]
MEVQFSPNAVDEPNLLYKLQRKVKVFQTSDPLPNRGYSLVTSSSKYAIVFVAVPNGTLSVYQLNQLVDKECEPQHLSVKLQEKPTHIAVNCDQELLLVTGGQILSFFKVTDFQHQNVSPSLNIKTDVNPSTFLSSLQWNPCAPESIAISFYDGTLLACNVSNGQMKKVPSKARCICWSPKGKQLVTGNSDGTLCQYKPDLTPAKAIPAPNLFEGAPIETLAIYWISTYQFAVVYKNANDNSRPAVTIINATKTGQLTCINYEDICYSMGSNRPSYYYLHGIPAWNLILASSSNSMELATLGSTDGSNWIQWSQPDEARPDLPLTDDKQESYPVGICIDTCGIHQLPWGENEMLPHMPLLHIVSQSGLLTTFNVINLNRNSQPVCAPPQLLALPTAAMTNAILDDTITKTTQVVAPVLPAQPKVEQNQQQSIPQSVPLTNQFSAIQNVVPIKPSTAQLQTFAPAPSAQISEPKDVKPIQQTQPQISVAKHKSTPEPETAQIEENAARKAEQERLNKLKANEELKNMLVKEVNDFQMELYKFMVKTRETQARLQRDIESINANFNLSSLDTEQLKKDCSLDELKSDIVQLKLELVRACAVVAEARTHAETKDLHQWTQADPLTSKRVASVKKLAYYVQTQLEQAQRALDYKWKELEARDASLRPGQRMIRPILDDVYQPLVKQQEILSRQQAVLRTLRNTLNECDITPMFKSTNSLLRSTPFRNKDPLSKLTKNILNMSLERQTETKKPHLSATKLDALRDILSNHKTVKIKPVNVELRQQLAAIKLNYEKSMKEKAMKTNVQQAPIETAPETQVKVEQPEEQPAPPIVKVEPKVVPVKLQPFIAPSFTPVNNNMKPIAPGVANVARTLFVDEPQQEPPKSVQQTPQIQVQPTKPQPLDPSSPTNTRSVLKDLLQNKTQNAAEPKTESNIFKSTPNAFSFPASATSQAANIFESKPLSGINNMFNKFQPQVFEPQAKPQTAPNPKSEETGEPETSIATPKPFTVQTKANKPLTNLFGMKQTSSFVASTPNTSDVSKSNQQEILPKTEKVAVKSIEKVSEKLKENIPQKPVECPEDQANDMKENIVKPLVLKTVNKESTPVSSIPQSVATSAPAVTTKSESQKPILSKADNKDVIKSTSDTTTKSTASSIFAAANASIVTKPQPIFGTVTTASSEASTPSDVDTLSPDDSPTNLSMKLSAFGSPTTTTSSASSIFSAAVASQPKITTQSGSIFSTSPVATTSSVFGSTPGSLFATTSTTQSSIFGAPTTESVFSGTAAKSSVFSTPSPASPTPVFGTTTQSGSIFGSAFTQTTTQSVFGSSNTTSVFGAPTSTQSSPVFATTTTTASVFGTNTSTTQSPVFGTSTTSAPSVFSAPSTQSSIFGSATTTTSSLFGGTATTAATQASVFGTSGSSSVFGSPTPSTPSVFGGSPQPSVFGTTTASTQASVFGTSAPATQASIFGAAPTTQASIFGAPPATTTQSSSLFGSAEANLFAAASISTTSAPTQGSGGNIFGGGSAGSVFGSGTNTNVFGGKTTFAQSNATAASIFGAGAAFGQKPATNLWSGGNTSGGGFGSTGFGQPATTQSSSLFGGTTGESFSSPAPSQPFGSPQPAPAFGSGEATPSVFGSPTQQTASAFGGSPVFGSKPVFGQSAGFGSATSGGGFGSFGGFNKSPSSGFGASASFGGGATFGGTAFGNTSPGKMFGGTAPSFGSATQSNSTFENLATQNTVTFGNLAQQSGQPTQPASSFNTSPSFTGWRG